MTAHGSLPLSVATRSDLTPTEKLIAMHIYGLSRGGKAWAWCSNAYLVSITGFSERTIRRALRRLIDADLIERRGETSQRQLRSLVTGDDLQTPAISGRSGGNSGHGRPETPAISGRHNENRTRSKARPPRGAEAGAHAPPDFSKLKRELKVW